MPAALYLQKDQVLICIKGQVNLRAMVWLEGLGNLKKFCDLIGIRTSDLPLCGIVSQPSLPLQAPIHKQEKPKEKKKSNNLSFHCHTNKKPEEKKTVTKPVIYVLFCCVDNFEQ
jgi:hypothetical protein